MDLLHLWAELESSPMSGWIRPALGPPPLPPIDPHSRLLWCGIGGSLGSSNTLVQALGTPEHRRNWMPLVGPEPEAGLLEPSDQLVLASKSGRTLELWTWISHLRAQPGWGRWKHPPLVLTQDDGNPLARTARTEGWPLLQIPGNVGGRYSAFTPIGTLPLAWMGRDIQDFLLGGRRVLQETKAGHGTWGSRVWMAVDQLVEGYSRNIRAWVLMPYCQRLQALGAWWVQLVAESLGKTSRDGNRVGLIPIPAIGPHDQHAQFQRWMGGPKNVGVFILTVGSSASEEFLVPPILCPYPGLGRWKPSQILEAEAEGTHHALMDAGVPAIWWQMENALCEEELGSLLMAWQLIVALTGLALRVDPFDQPAVEAGKQWTETLLGMGPQGEGIWHDEARAAGR